MIIPSNYYLTKFREGSEYVSGFKYVKFQNIKGLLICQCSEFPGLHSLPIFVNMTGFSIPLNVIMEGF